MLPLVIVDDSPEDALLAARVLRQCKILNPITTLPGGSECISFLDGEGVYSTRALPCLLLLDLAMAPVSGVDVLRRFTSHFQNGLGSVAVMLSGLQDLNLVNLGYKLGATTFWMKPLRCEDLLDLLNSLRGVAVDKSKNGYTLSLERVKDQRAKLHLAS